MIWFNLALSGYIGLPIIDNLQQDCKFITPNIQYTSCSESYHDNKEERVCGKNSKHKGLLPSLSYIDSKKFGLFREEI